MDSGELHLMKNWYIYCGSSEVMMVTAATEAEARKKARYNMPCWYYNEDKDCIEKCYPDTSIVARWAE
jgi:hypothetical protein